MADNRRGRENRYYFSRGQMVILGGAFTLASVVIFLIGMMVGKEIEERKILHKEEPLVKMPVKPTATGTGAAQAPTKSEEATVYESAVRPREAQAGDAKASLAVAPDKPAKAERKEAAKAVVAAAPEPPVEKVVARAEDAKKIEPADAGEGKIWRAQVNAFPDERSAKLLVDRLKNKGYNPYITEVSYRGKPWYRVNVGRFASREEADKVVETLKSKENYPKAFAATK
jgi:cell division protein FtsN